MSTLMNPDAQPLEPRYDNSKQARSKFRSLVALLKPRVPSSKADDRLKRQDSSQPAQELIQTRSKQNGQIDHYEPSNGRKSAGPVALKPETNHTPVSNDRSTVATMAAKPVLVTGSFLEYPSASCGRRLDFGVGIVSFWVASGELARIWQSPDGLKHQIKSFFEGSTDFPDVRCHIYLVGVREKSVRPTVVLWGGREPQMRKQACDLLKESELVQTLYPGLRVVAMTLPPDARRAQQVAGPRVGESSRPQGGRENQPITNTDTYPKVLFGESYGRTCTALYIDLDGTSELRRATAGGVLSDGNDLYCWTASHAFEATFKGSILVETEEIPELYGFDADDGEASAPKEYWEADQTLSNMDGREVPRWTEPEETPEILPHMKKGLDFYRHFEDQTLGMDFDYTLSPRISKGRRDSLPLLAGSGSTPDIGSDYAVLPQISERKSKLPHPQVYFSIPTPSRDSLNVLGHVVHPLGSGHNLDYALIQITSPFAIGDVLESHKYSNVEDEAQHALSVAEILQSQQIQIVTNFRGVRYGKLLETAVLVFSRMDFKSQELWTVRTQPSLRFGDCGAWAISVTTNELLGHVIEADSTNGLAYIVPAHQVLADIKRSLHRDLSLRPDLIIETARSKLRLGKEVASLGDLTLWQRIKQRKRFKDWVPSFGSSQRQTARGDHNLGKLAVLHHKAPPPLFRKVGMTQAEHPSNTDLVSPRTGQRTVGVS